MRLIALLAATFMFLAGPASAYTVDVVVYKSSQTMTVDVDGETWYVWDVSTAKASKITPTGNFVPQFFSIDHKSSLYENAPMPYSVFYSGNFAIHGSYETRRLGTPASNGCVRLEVNNAAELFHLIRDAGEGNTSIRILD